MNREQKMAWVCVVCMALALAVAITVFVINRIFGAPKAIYAAMIPCFSMGLAGLLCLFVPKDKGKVIRDERDLMIKKNAAHAGFIGAFLFTCVVCMTTFLVLGHDASISVKWLPMIWIGTSFAQAFFYSLTIIVDYGMGGKDAE
jgi:hypothetical protein